MIYFVWPILCSCWEFILLPLNNFIHSLLQHYFAAFFNCLWILLSWMTFYNFFSLTTSFIPFIWLLLSKSWQIPREMWAVWCWSHPSRVKTTLFPVTQEFQCNFNAVISVRITSCFHFPSIQRWNTSLLYSFKLLLKKVKTSLVFALYAQTCLLLLVCNQLHNTDSTAFIETSPKQAEEIRLKVCHFLQQDTPCVVPPLKLLIISKNYNELREK